MRQTTRFRQLIEAPAILVLPGVHDALSAKLAAAAGFEAITMGGYAATAALLGEPDSSQLSLGELADHYARICDAVDLPVFADGDTGFGNVTNVRRTVRLLEKAGVAGLFIEDQAFPKRCGHMAGKSVIPAVEMAAKVKAAVDARRDPDLVIMARTDALAVNGLDDAIERANLYREAGADLLFVEAPTSLAQMRRICAEIDGPTFANNLDHALTPILPAAELEAIGYAAVAFAVSGLYAIAATLEQVYGAIARDGTSAAVHDRMWSFERFNRFVGLETMRAREAAETAFAAGLADRWRR
jgi:2-methylisocitrate lyase-like PEP mutase family enzyme